MEQKPKRPCPTAFCALLRHVLPARHYRRWIGRHEDESTRLWRGMAARLAAERAILDIGAFQGDYALAARTTNATAPIYAFEPNPDSASSLRTILAGSGVEVVEKAVSDRCGKVRFCCAAAQSRIDAGSQEAPGSCDVTTVTLDSWAQAAGVNSGLIKIDVEGAEAAVLRGSRQLIDLCRPAILCEVLSDEAGQRVMSEIPSYYFFWHIDENGRATRQDCITRRIWRNKNWLLLPNDQEPEVVTERHPRV
jgi:FkbM family methyltransferase